MPNLSKNRTRPWDLPPTTKHQKKSWAKERNPFYDSPAWRSARLICLREEPICKYCRTDNHLAESKVCDHIIPIEWGGSLLDRTNHQGMCASCHNTKSSLEGKYQHAIQLLAYINQGGVGVKNFWPSLQVTVGINNVCESKLDRGV